MPISDPRWKQFGAPMTGELLEYASLLDEIKGRIRRAQTRAVQSANREMLALYWDVGRLIESRQESEGWGSGVIPRLSRDLHNELPEIKGFSESNLNRMVRFYREYPALIPILPRLWQNWTEAVEARKCHSLWHR